MLSSLVFGRKGPSGFSWSSTAEEVTAGISAAGLTAIVTGASSGIGAETARTLALRGAHVVMAVRSLPAAQALRDDVLAQVPEAKIDVMELNLSSMASVRAFASEFIAKGLPLNILMYSSIGAYGQSKLANILHANELARRFKEEGVNITANSLHPGSIITNLLRHHSILDVIHRTLGKLVLKNAQQGAATSCYVALHPQVKGVSGKYFCDSNQYEPSEKAKDISLAKKLWDFSIELIT
ncbi:hypothetical protein PR202_ga16729 [Eleusine coracana subsp. coracana]|uniref:Uncharacterized protein n=1 Tax=Eleusine coracana subsp. coracana TaxID=191504 RepID=A0AAV5CNL3_ELECO|nr:hypothetical protein PR202_ga16729 [Eleusine coracana subsp. coracana]